MHRNLVVSYPDLVVLLSDRRARRSQDVQGVIREGIIVSIQPIETKWIELLRAKKQENKMTALYTLQQRVDLLE